MKTVKCSPIHSPGRRVLMVGVAALPLWAGRALAQDNPEVAAYKTFVGSRAVRIERLVLDIPRIADNGNVVPVRIAMPGPFAPGAEVKPVKPAAANAPRRCRGHCRQRRRRCDVPALGYFRNNHSKWRWMAIKGFCRRALQIRTLQ